MNLSRRSRSAVLTLTIVLTLITLIGMGTGASASDKILRVGISAEPDFINPVSTTVMMYESVAHTIVEKLFYYDENTKITPWLATEWGWVDSLTFEISIREGIFFSNGEPLNAAAVAFSMDLYQASIAHSYRMPRGIYAGTFVVDDNTVQIRLNRPYSALLHEIARTGGVYPPVYYTQVGETGFNEAPVGSGPFVFDEWVKGSHISVKRNSDYWGGPHPISQIIFRIIPETISRVAALESGEIDLAVNLTLDSATRLMANNQLQVIRCVGLRKMLTFFDTNIGPTWYDQSTAHEPADDPRVRVALNYAVDKQAIVDSVFGGAATALNGQLMLPGEEGYDPNINPYAYDPTKAIELLTAAGYPDGFEMTLTYTVGRYAKDQELGEIVAAYLEEVGIKVNQRPVEWGGFQALRNEGTISHHQWGLLAQPTAHTNFAFYGAGARYQWHVMTPEFDDLLYRAEREPDAAIRNAMYTQMAWIVHNEAPFIFLVSPNDIYGATAKLVGFVPRPDQMLWFYNADLVD